MSRAAALAVVACAVPGAAAEPNQFERAVKPILAAKCFKCHGADATSTSRDLRTAAAIKQGGETGPERLAFHHHGRAERLADISDAKPVKALLRDPIPPTVGPPTGIRPASRPCHHRRSARRDLGCCDRNTQRVTDRGGEMFRPLRTIRRVGPALVGSPHTHARLAPATDDQDRLHAPVIASGPASRAP